MELIWLVVIGTSIWVAVDASTLGARKGTVKGLGDMSAAGWFFACLLLWIIAFPMYLATRPKLVEAKTAREAPQAPVTAWGPYGVAGGQAPAVSTGPATGWYRDPLGRFELRYWNGADWTEHVSSGGAPATDPVPAH